MSYQPTISFKQKLGLAVNGFVIALLLCSIALNVYLYKQSYLNYVKPMPKIEHNQLER